MPLASEDVFEQALNAYAHLQARSNREKLLFIHEAFGIPPSTMRGWLKRTTARTFAVGRPKLANPTDIATVEQSLHLLEQQKVPIDRGLMREVAGLLASVGFSDT
jgi:hypothetical protein